MEYALLITALGMSVVLGVLGVNYLIILAISWIDQGGLSRASAAPSEVVEDLEESVPVEEEVTEELQLEPPQAQVPDDTLPPEILVAIQTAIQCYEAERQPRLIGKSGKHSPAFPC